MSCYQYDMDDDENDGCGCFTLITFVAVVYALVKLLSIFIGII